MDSTTATPQTPAPQPYFDGPAPDFVPTDSILNPFSIYRKGEALLRSQLRALSVWHLVNIVRAHGLSTEPASVLNAMTAPELTELIVAEVQRTEETPSRR